MFLFLNNSKYKSKSTPKYKGGGEVSDSWGSTYSKTNSEDEDYNQLYSLYPDGWSEAKGFWVKLSKKQQDAYVNSLSEQDAANEHIAESWLEFINAKSEDDFWENATNWDEVGYSKGGEVSSKSFEDLVSLYKTFRGESGESCSIITKRLNDSNVPNNIQLAVKNVATADKENRSERSETQIRDTVTSTVEYPDTYKDILPKAPSATKAPSDPNKLVITDNIRTFMPTEQLASIKGNDAVAESVSSIDEIIESMPVTYEQDGKGKKAIAYLHYFTGSNDYFITEKDKGSVNEDGSRDDRQVQAFGYVRAGGYPELGYISIEELKSHPEVQMDFHFKPKTLAAIDKEYFKEGGEAEKYALGGIAAVAAASIATGYWLKNYINTKGLPKVVKVHKLKSGRIKYYALVTEDNKRPTWKEITGDKNKEALQIIVNKSSSTYNYDSKAKESQFVYQGKNKFNQANTSFYTVKKFKEGGEAELNEYEARVWIEGKYADGDNYFEEQADIREGRNEYRAIIAEDIFGEIDLKSLKLIGENEDGKTKEFPFNFKRTKKIKKGDTIQEKINENSFSEYVVTDVKGTTVNTKGKGESFTRKFAEHQLVQDVDSDKWIAAKRFKDGGEASTQILYLSPAGYSDDNMNEIYTSQSGRLFIDMASQTDTHQFYTVLDPDWLEANAPLSDYGVKVEVVDNFKRGGKPMAGRREIYRDETIYVEYNEVSDTYSIRDSKTNLFMKAGGAAEFCQVGTQVQTLIFNKDKFPNEKKAKKWAKSHDFKFGKIDEKENSFRIRQNDPSKFKKSTFRTIKFTDGLQAVIACPVVKAESVKPKAEKPTPTEKPIVQTSKKANIYISRKPEMSGGYGGKTSEEIWNAWNVNQRKHFLQDHLSDRYSDSTARQISHVKWHAKKVTPSVRAAFDKHVATGIYKAGGKIY